MDYGDINVLERQNVWENECLLHIDHRLLNEVSSDITVALQADRHWRECTGITHPFSFLQP